jgi:hypothetical protein
MTFAKVCDDLDIKFDLKKVLDLREVVHTYGSGSFPSIPKELCWMTYEEQRVDISRYGESQTGAISFSRNTAEYLPDFVDSVVYTLQKRFPAIAWRRDRVHLIRTHGYIPPHVDEVRTCALNIGLAFSSTAETQVSTNNQESDFLVGSKDFETYIMQDKEAYLLDVSKFHAVSPLTLFAQPRYLVTYGFGVPFHNVLWALRRKPDQ